MKAKKKIKKGESGSLKVDPDVLYEAKKICKREGYLLYNYATAALVAKNASYKDGK